MNLKIVVKGFVFWLVDNIVEVLHIN